MVTAGREQRRALAADQRGDVWGVAFEVHEHLERAGCGVVLGDVGQGSQQRSGALVHGLLLERAGEAWERPHDLRADR